MKIKLKKTLLISSIIGTGLTLTASAVSIPSLINYSIVKDIIHNSYEKIISDYNINYLIDAGYKNENEYFLYYLSSYYTFLHYSTEYLPNYDFALLRLIKTYNPQTTETGFIDNWAPTIAPFVTFLVLMVACLVVLITTISLKNKLNKEIDITINKKETNEQTDK